MSFRVPDTESSNNSSNESFFDLPSCPLHENSNMSNDIPSNSDVPMENASNLEFLSNLTAADIQDILGVVTERRAKQQNTGQSGQQPSQMVVRHNKDVQLPKWNGKPEDFKFYIGRLEF